jgi:hypothetical protein
MIVYKIILLLLKCQLQDSYPIEQSTDEDIALLNRLQMNLWLANKVVMETSDLKSH